MTWFKVDDDLHSHPKAIQAGEAAMGLWVMAGSWAANQLTDGFVPEYICQRLSPKKWKLLSNKLVTVGLWSKRDQGFQFHEWNEDGRQPTRAQILADRKAAAQRQKKWRENAKHSQQRNGVTNASRNGVSHTVRNAYPDPYPPKGGRGGPAYAEPDPEKDPVGWMAWQRQQHRKPSE